MSIRLLVVTQQEPSPGFGTPYRPAPVPDKGPHYRMVRDVGGLMMLRQLAIFLFCLPASLGGAEPRSVSIDSALPFGQSPVDYLGSATTDAIAKLDRQLAEGKVTLSAVPGRGYLDSVLAHLGVSVTSQLLVYSKTAVSHRLIKPKTPRAIYFSDDIYVAWVPGAVELELAAIDPDKGSLFYILKQPRPGETPRFQRKQSCLACHIGRSTLSVPGGMSRSFLVDRTGKPIEGYSRVTAATPLEKRWGGWYVTGRLGQATHMGNLLGPDDNRRHRREPHFRASLARLDGLVDLSGYLSGHSDVIAHLVLDHQLHGQNLITRVAYEHQLGRRSDAEDRLLRYLLLAESARWTGTLRGTDGFTRWFLRQGPRTSKGRSLRALDLDGRLFRHRLSYLVYSRSLAALPEEPRRRLGRRLWAVLSGESAGGLEKLLTRSERLAVREILEATRDHLPPGWQGRASR